MNNSDRYANQMESVFKHASLGIVVVNTSGEIIAANPFLCNLFGYVESEILEKKIEVLIPSRHQHAHESHREKYNDNPRNRLMGLGMDLFAKKKDGTEFPVEVSLGNYQKENEKFTIAFVSDITIRKNDAAQVIKLANELEQKVSERTEELQLTLQKLEEANHKFEISLAYQKSIIDNADVMLFVTNKKGVVQFFNTEATHITGYSEGEVVKNFTLDIFHEKDDLERCKMELFEEYNIVVNTATDIIIEKATKNKLQGVECYYVKKDGSKIPVSISITSIYDYKNEITGFMGVVIDISERKKAEANLMNSLEKEKRLGELKSRFVSMASHEFRTPLSTILSSTYLVEKYTTIDEQPKRERHLQRIISSVSSLIGILDEFLSVGKIEEGKISAKFSEFNLPKLITVLIDDMSTNLKEGQKFEYAHQGIEKVYLDPALIKYIVLNLLSNAIKFSFEKTVISINTIVNEEVVILSIKDRGIGISTEDKRHLMEQFFRGSNASNIQGTGLGLYIVSKYAEQMNGEVHCDSEIEKGTTFSIHFKPINVP